MRRRGSPRAARSSRWNTPTACCWWRTTPARRCTRFPRCTTGSRFQAPKYNEFEMLRKAGIRHADLKGYTYSREDVTAKSLANAYSQSIGSLFSADPKPLEVELLVVEVGQDGKPNELYRISFDGSIIDERGVAVIGGKADALLTFLKARWTAPTFSLREALRLSIEALDTVTNQKLGSEALEAAVLDRTRTGRTFRRIGSAEIKALLA